MAFIEDFTPQKSTAKILSVGLFCGAEASTNAGRKITKRRKKDELSPAIGKNYINKNVSFLLTFYL